MTIKKSLYDVHQIDARKIAEVIEGEIVDVTITSPPYFDLKDYGHKKQVGFGQSYSEYLRDLRHIFQGVYECTKKSGTLWVVIDSFRRDGELVPLPFDFSNEIRKCGWKLQEIIIWGKDRTVPWTHKGQMRKLFEYILVFSKTDNFTFDIDKIRKHEELKKWWVKYPERYNPNGKTPEAIWNFEIPMQGSWGNGYIRHFCPLPEEMIEQILELTTKENDVVLDPFSGSGAVLSKAKAMKRKYIGFELNRQYISMFKKYIKETHNTKAKSYGLSKDNKIEKNEFHTLILNLRALKYAKLIIRKLDVKGSGPILKIYVEKQKIKPVKKNAIIAVEYKILVGNRIGMVKFKKEVEEVCNQAPLSKFGIQSTLQIYSSEKKFFDAICRKKVYVYPESSPHKFKCSLDKKIAVSSSVSEAILSGIKVQLHEMEYE